MDIKTIRTVHVDEVLADCPGAQTELDHADIDVSYGDADGTLLEPNNFMEKVIEKLDESGVGMELITIERRIETLNRNGVLIDLGS